MARDAQDDLRITDQFNFEVFWADHGKQVTAAVVTIVGVGFVLLYWQHQSSMQAEQAADSLARATDVSALERVIQDFPKSKTAAEALSQLADLYYRNAKYAEAASTYGIILRDFPTYPLAESAKLSLATVLEAQGNMNGAGAQYQQIISSSPNSYVGNAARMGLARCLEIQGQRKEARQTYEEILAMGQNSPWFTQAYLRWVVLNRDAPPEKTPTPSVKPAVGPSQNSLQLPSLPTSP